MPRLFARLRRARVSPPPPDADVYLLLARIDRRLYRLEQLDKAWPPRRLWLRLGWGLVWGLEAWRRWRG